MSEEQQVTETILKRIKQISIEHRKQVKQPILYREWLEYVTAGFERVEWLEVFNTELWFQNTYERQYLIPVEAVYEVFG